MGMLFSHLWRRLSGPQEYKVCIVGLDAAGKTTILYKLKLGGETIESYPTIGSNVEDINWSHRKGTTGNVNFQVWDLGGQSSLRPTWTSCVTAKPFLLCRHSAIKCIHFLTLALPLLLLPRAATLLTQQRLSW
jgi:small GTP-binding protein